MSFEPTSDQTLGGEDVLRASRMERALRTGLASGDRALRGVPSVLTHMLAGSGQALVSDAVVARLRGMLASIAQQLLQALASTPAPDIDPVKTDAIVDSLSSDSALLSYCYALAIETRVTDTLEQRMSVDPILSPLIQELIASREAATAELAMSAMAAQSRFVQSQRRMDLALNELPAELFATVLKRWQSVEKDERNLPAATAKLKAAYDEGAGRGGLLLRLVAKMRGGAVAGLEVEHAGIALFATSLASLSKQPRELAVLACHESQGARLALSLRAAGMDGDGIERQFRALRPAEQPSQEIGMLESARAAAILHHGNAPVERCWPVWKPMK